MSSEPMATVGFMLTLKIPYSLFEKISREDKLYLKKLSVHHSSSLTHRKYVFYLADINRVRSLLSKYGIKVRFPPSKEIKRFGINYTGDSIDIQKISDIFIITQYFPDGEVRTHNIPEQRVWDIYYVLKNMEEHLGRNTFEAREVWEQIARRYQMAQFFDDEYHFNKSAFNGSRGTYHNFYYYPIKILEHLGKIDYSKRGRIKLLSKEEMKERLKAREMVTA